jgi:DNA recombination protein RmuC
LYWQQQSMADNAKEIHKKAREFYDRVTKFSHDLAKMGRGINTVVGAYNDAVGSYDGSVIPSGRRLEELKVADGAQRKLADLPAPAVPRTVKQISPMEEE